MQYRACVDSAFWWSCQIGLSAWCLEIRGFGWIVCFFCVSVACRIGPQPKCLPFTESLVVQIFISVHNLYNSSANYMWEIFMPVPAVLLIALAVWYKGRVTDEKKS